MNCSANCSRQVASMNMFSSTPILQICISTMNLLIIASMVFVSLKIDRKDMSRLYTLWLYLAHCPSDVIQIAISILQLNDLVDSSGYYYRDKVDIVQMTGKIFVDIANQVYRILALIMVSATFMSYSFPLTFPKFLHPSKRSLLYSIGLLFMTLQALLGNTYSTYTIAYRDTHIAAPILELMFYVLQLLSIGPMVLLVLMYILSVGAIISFTKERANRGACVARHRRQLLSVIIYATTPNLLLFPTILVGICNIILNTMSREQKIQGNLVVQITGVVNAINRFCIYIRLPIITISTFIAFGPYRMILYRIPLPCCKKMFVKVQAISSSGTK
ncbi:hypothetical protein QR680_006465 [Steinernema hermaphroditum]|uniref:Uncharacterized protein n=1 Tax=Steinernema hermaphroditum TaxID=289476 RepID=A0AA39HX40_9BILA|nr:hypothetical protein QR680_006465 [Steinernema hermaphroditum]